MCAYVYLFLLFTMPCLTMFLSVRMKTDKENPLFLFFLVIELSFSYMYSHAASAISVKPNRRPQDDHTRTSPPVRKEMRKHKNTSLNEMHSAPPRKFETMT
uniref:Uncharacterized protein n=1 Tax=Rhipicephalus appendiculatus TaxID=34631 RepID=A0A131YX15_RHIAP